MGHFLGNSVDALKEIADMTSQLQNSLIRLENFQKLIELQHDLLGTDNLIAPGRVISSFCVKVVFVFIQYFELVCCLPLISYIGICCVTLELT